MKLRAGSVAGLGRAQIMKKPPKVRTLGGFVIHDLTASLS
jgi:hypothetical protein